MAVPWGHRRKAQGTLSEEDQRTERCCWSVRVLVAIQDKEHCFEHGCGEDPASVEDQGTCGHWQVKERAGEASCDHQQASWDEPGEYLQDPSANGWEGHACVAEVVLDEVVRYEA
jgi:hypothetical protein